MYSLSQVVKSLKKQRHKKIVLIGGAYDIVHIGHIRILTKAKKRGDILVVGVDDDKFIKKRKGTHRPIIPEKQRAELLSNLKPVDYVFINRGRALYHDINLRAIKPNILVFGTEKNRLPYRLGNAKRIAAEFPNIKVVFLNSGIKSVSTTHIESRCCQKKSI